MRIYSGESGGHISVWVSNQCGEVSRAIPIVWCNPREDGPGPILPRIVNPNPILDISAQLKEIDEYELNWRTNNSNIDDSDNKKTDQDESVKVYPNPVGPQFMLSIERTGLVSEKPVKISSVHLYDLSGRFINSYIQDSDEDVVAMSNFSNGKYYVRVEFSNGKRQIIPIIKVE